MMKVSVREGKDMTSSRHWLERAPTIGALIVLALVIASVVMAGRNRGLQEQAAAGQQRLANAQTAANLDNTLIRLLTTAAVEHDDAAIKALLAANGITYRQNAAPGTTSGSTPAGAPTAAAGGAQ